MLFMILAYEGMMQKSEITSLFAYFGCFRWSDEICEAASRLAFDNSSVAIGWGDMVPRDNPPRDNPPRDNVPQDNPPRRQCAPETIGPETICPGDNVPRR